MPVVLVTRLHLSSWRFLPQFILHSNRSLRQTKAAPGIMATQIRKTDAFWTLSIWKHEKAMQLYLRSGAHKATMAQWVNWCDEAASVYWEQPNPDLPSWEQVADKLKTQGRLLAVNQPSSAQVAGQINVT